MIKTFFFLKETISYNITGQGSPIVFLHGFLEDSSIWDNVKRHLNLSHKILTVDLPGHGKSTCISENHTMASMAKIVQQICLAENMLKPIVFGHSMGGYIALELTKIYEVDIALVHSNFWNDSTEKKIDRNRVIQIAKANLSLFVSTAIPNLFYAENSEKCKKHIEKLIEKASEMDIKSVVCATKAMRDRKNNSAVLMVGNVAIIQGENDPVFSKSTMSIHLNTISEKPYFIEIESCGHMGFAEQPSAFLEAVKRIIIKFSELKAFN
ncbi:MAG: alpha/beta fold hydrolase [Crocinitomicaceae bacterium]